MPSAFFYNDTLVPEAKETHRLEGWSGWKGSRGIPIKFIGHDGHDESHEEGISFYNLREVELAVKTVQSLLSPDSWPVRPDGQEGKAEEPLAQGEIAVMSPFREQVKRLRKAFRMASLKHVNVGPVEAYQGSEYRFVIICTTRARERFLGKDRDKGVGLVFEHRRVNVALTRAKEGLVVIGNPWILERDSIWMEWMNFAWRHGAVEFDGDAPPVATPRSPLDANKENQGPRKQAASIVSGVSSGAATPLTYASIASAGKSRPVGEWAPQSRGGDIEISGLVSRLETALVFKSKARDGCVFGFNAGWDEDDPMFLAGITAEEEVRKRMDDEADEGYGLGITG